MKFNIVEDSEMVSICINSESTLDGFIDIYVDEAPVSSIFKSKKEARMFAEILVKLLESVMK